MVTGPFLIYINLVLDAFACGLQQQYEADRIRLACVV